MVTWVLYGSTVYMKKSRSWQFFTHTNYTQARFKIQQILSAANRSCTAAGSNSVGHLYHSLLCAYVHLGCLACECEIVNMNCPCWIGRFKERDHLEYLGRSMSKLEGNIKIDLKYFWRVCTGLFGLKVEVSGVLLWLCSWTVMFCKMWGNSWPGKELLIFQDWCAPVTQLVSWLVS